MLTGNNPHPEVPTVSIPHPEVPTVCIPHPEVYLKGNPHPEVYLRGNPHPERIYPLRTILWENIPLREAKREVYTPQGRLKGKYIPL